VFLDEAEIEVRAGDGGNGIVAFRREKFAPRGGPSGGNGGRGGDVILVADEGVNTLHAFRFTKRYEAGRGGHGGGSDKRGKDGDDVRLPVPVGTVVRDAGSGEVLADLSARAQEAVVARGGRGGRGNAAFKGPTNQAPRYAEKGEPGQARRLALELKLLADVGLVGLPNAGKSTLLAAISAARPKIADYPFTTLSPSLGVAEIGDDVLVFADIPGLIEGASEGAGLGDRFLRHVERTRLLVHLVDGMSPDPLADLRTINAELAAFSPELGGRPQIVAFNKVDVPEARHRWASFRASVHRAAHGPLEAGARKPADGVAGGSGGAPGAGRAADPGTASADGEAGEIDDGDVLAISAATGEGVPALLYRVLERFRELPPPSPPPDTVPVLRPVADDEDAFVVAVLQPGVFRLSGTRIERTAAMTDWQNEDGVRRFQRVLEAMGIAAALRERGVAEGDTVVIGEVALEWVD
jgi:GTPase